MVGVSSVLSVTQLGSLWNAELGAVSLVLLSVVHWLMSAQVPVGVQLAAPAVEALTHPAGKAGAVTPSKFSVNTVFNTPRVKV
jgi:hypothetical protein